ncbi:hypothetical protein CFC21_009500 [Triticum aestivum]|uniref:Uncharacterized protein n=1 Tax=Triticum aestivum TaxID=4565 RepID=A0A9R1DIT6_WHEAT|nr:hypothetical protein CFC21_009500 [Triticum aestivum]
MAAVRCAARRLGGSLLQRTQAAVAEEGRLLAPSRLMRSRQLSTKAHDIHRPCVEEFGLWIFQGDSCVCGCCYCFLWQWARSVAQAVTKENV